ncbi:D-alanyl-D-alanine carboxypeptidase DacC [Comamonas sp. PE63]|jgi:D-alanyl-D-alanine carboxypeptidase (penicillin-binding protein 5/6)|uniref:serine-type D-Ala-D-Ala carboxypeptidase n=4 Tax=Comamonas TaxID=283 RepID=A0A1Y1J812_COMTE|nr:MULTISPECIES: D-alanyl-D-alanine carboxypeptidase family protein [Comamonas]AIJ44502.1 cytochrome C550 [Comamonas testosteroni TK102]EED69847.1 Serine-type D-Ala-D-Ala carboxypeptidase [Comamonas testosteroni KF-1]MBS3020526.1 D-alanyl-D-alanine carboxypeptidase DacC [Comamonas sp. PE63]MPS91440.1 D-alanyl-D-alanine carboxypeptidase [Comamonas sp.]NIF86275.1 D-alanyl-D-alanine carboxypeptidase [Comamonas sp. Tr-654]
MKPIYSTLRVLAVAAAVAPVFAMAQVAAPVPPEIAARNYLLVDVTAGQVLGAKDIDAPVEQASLTKLMSAYVVFDALRAKKITLEQRMPVSERAWKMPGSRMFIDPKMQVPVNDLLSGMIIQSGNDATMALAEAVGGTAENFVKMMNDQAKALGMKNTSYKNPEGLTEPGHLTTARDLSILAQRLMHDFPEYMHYYSTKQYSYPGTPASNGSNRNALLFRDPTVDGLKTGHTNAAGYCLVATAKRDLPNVGQRRLLSIVLGTASEKARANESQKLLNWGYTAFDAVKLFDADQPVATPAVWKGAANAVKIGKADGAVVVTVPSGTGGKLTTEVVRQDPLIAPIAKGQSMGVLKVKSGADVVAEVPLVALEAVEQAGFFGRLWDTIRLWIK